MTDPCLITGPLRSDAPPVDAQLALAEIQVRQLGALRDIGFRDVSSEDLTSEWGNILEERFRMYRALREETVKIGTPSGDEDFYRSYARLVALVQARTLGGGRFTARK